MTVPEATQGSAATVRATVAAGPRPASSDRGGSHRAGWFPAGWFRAGWFRAGWLRVRAAAAAVRWYVRQVMGDDAYPTYVAHQRAAHPGCDVVSEREFWRARMAEQDANPGSRCC